MKKTINHCLAIAQEYNPNHSQKNGYRHFSFIIQNDKLLGWDINQDGPCLYGYKQYQKLHSENAAYFKCKTFINKKKPFSIINIRLNKQGGLKISAPCDCCISWLKKLNCKSVLFSISDELGFAKIDL